MTVIAYDGKTMAADRQWTYGSEIAGYRTKMVKWSGGYWTSAGRLVDHTNFAIWIEDRSFKWKPRKDFNALYSENGKVYEIDNDLDPWPAFTPTSFGDGGRSAMALMRAGFSAEDAVKETCKYNIYCGGKVDVVDV